MNNSGLGGDDRVGDRVVQLIVYYVIFMIAGDLAAYFIGLITEREFGGQASLIVFQLSSGISSLAVR